MNDKERQQKRRKKLYTAGFKPMQIWVNRKEQKQVKMNMTVYIKKLRKLTSGWEKDRLSKLFNLLIKITKAKKEVEKL